MRPSPNVIDDYLIAPAEKRPFPSPCRLTLSERQIPACYPSFTTLSLLGPVRNHIGWLTTRVGERPYGRYQALVSLLSSVHLTTQPSTTPALILFLPSRISGYGKLTEHRSLVLLLRGHNIASHSGRIRCSTETDHGQGAVI